MASMEELKREIAVAGQSIETGRGALQQAVSSFEEAQAVLVRAISGSSQSEASELNNSLAQIVESVTNASRLAEQVQSNANTFSERL